MNPESEALLERWPLPRQFNLPQESIIVIAGAYKGLAIQTLAELYPDYRRIEGFEPQSWACEEARERLEGYRDVNVMMYGLGVEDKLVQFPMGEFHTDAASFVNTGPNSRQQGEGWLWNADDALATVVGYHIDLFMCNIEGYEYQLLPYLAKKGWLSKMDRLAIQFHLNLGPGTSEEDMDKLITSLEKTHKIAYDERPAWVYFTR